MKRKMIIVAVVVMAANIFIVNELHAQKRVKANAAQVLPDAVKSSFKDQYGENSISTIKWSKGYHGNFLATFTNKENLTQIAEYNAEGVWIKSKVSYLSGNYPAAVANALNSQYAGATAKECVKIILPGIDPYYRVNVDGIEHKKYLLISEAGTVAD